MRFGAAGVLDAGLEDPSDGFILKLKL